MTELLSAQHYPARENLYRLNSAQRQLWDRFYGGSNQPRILNVSDIDPAHLAPFIRNIWTADISYDETGEFSDLSMRLFGAGLASIFGEASDAKLIGHDEKTHLHEKFGSVIDRLKFVAREMLKAEAPILTHSTYRSKHEELKSNAIIFPVCREGDVIDTMFGHTELSRKILK